MDWQDFEHLIRELFEKEFSDQGGEVKITQASRDRGVDAIVFDPDPIHGGKYVIQARRYTDTVDVSAVRDLCAVGERRERQEEFLLRPAHTEATHMHLRTMNQSHF
jgi:HJR/Mrr/RecB family endonuclease